MHGVMMEGHPWDLIMSLKVLWKGQTGSNSSSKVKEKVQALLHQLVVLPGLNSIHKPGFVYLLESDPDGVISYMPHPHSA